MATAEWPGFDKLMKRLGNASHITFAMVTPLLESWEKILVEGNRRKVLAGLQGNGQPMPEVRYRNGFAIRSRERTAKFGTNKFAMKGRGFKGVKQGDPHANGNLTTAEYKKLTGPPLAPRGEKSRVIANLETAIGQDGKVFYAVKAWREVVSKDGVPFLMAHFKGKATGKGHRTKLPVRDLRGTDKQERVDAGEAANAWGHLVLSGQITG